MVDIIGRKPAAGSNLSTATYISKESNVFSQQPIPIEGLEKWYFHN